MASEIVAGAVAGSSPAVCRGHQTASQSGSVQSIMPFGVARGNAADHLALLHPLGPRRFRRWHRARYPGRNSARLEGDLPRTRRPQRKRPQRGKPSWLRCITSTLSARTRRGQLRGRAGHRRSHRRVLRKRGLPAGLCHRTSSPEPRTRWARAATDTAVERPTRSRACPYRPCVGVVLMHPDGRILRRGQAPTWPTARLADCRRADRQGREPRFEAALRPKLHEENRRRRRACDRVCVETAEVAAAYDLPPKFSALNSRQVFAVRRRNGF